MPIRFRCVYCEQLLGIARRKAGTVVKCPNCSGQLIVPPPEPAAVGAEDDDATEGALGKENHAAPTDPAPAKLANGGAGDPTDGGLLFERNDFDELLRPALAKKGSASGNNGGRVAPKPPPPPPPAFELSDLSAPAAVAAAPAAAPIIAPPLPASKRRSGIFLSPLLIALVLGFIFISVSGSFIIGLLVGRVLGQ
jgi:hypothetical protein